MQLSTCLEAFVDQEPLKPSFHAYIQWILRHTYFQCYPHPMNNISTILGIIQQQILCGVGSPIRAKLLF